MWMVDQKEPSLAVKWARRWAQYSAVRWVEHWESLMVGSMAELMVAQKAWHWADHWAECWASWMVVSTEELTAGPREDSWSVELGGS